ncbi:MAG: glycoside hydrolase family 13 protein [Oscillospiraceae bacterium]|nr:glycoside hydrolase family 13 protein [Candidatus Equicaccousia limihippi]
MRILFDSKNSTYKTVFGALKENERCGFRIDIPSSCLTKTAELVLLDDNQNQKDRFSFNLKTSGDGYDIFTLDFVAPAPDLYFYYFFITTQNESFRLFKYGFDMTNIEDGELWQLTVYPQDFIAAKGFSGRVMYQIFPDRFNKAGECDLTGKLEPYYTHQNTHDIPDFLPDEYGEVKNCDFYGGNINGIAQKLDYLYDLGVRIIYLNPIFKAYSNHRYDTADYLKPDEMLGTPQDFKNLCDRAHKKGMKIILDGVFSHTGSNSLYFDKKGIFGGGAYKNGQSQYREWYDFSKGEDDYTSWWGINTLPCVNETNQSYLEFITGEKGVLSYWQGLGADGWRLDVADELPEEFIQSLKNRVNKNDKNALVLGEVWEDASNKISYGYRRHYFSHGLLHGVMNYPLRKAIIDFCMGTDGGDNFKNTVMSIAENYPTFVQGTLMNFLSSHDTPRILTVLSGVTIENKTDRANFELDGHQMSLALKKLYVAMFLQFFMIGMPSIYYGDEIAAQGFEDPFCRAYFDWEKQSELREYIKSLSALKEKIAEFERVQIETCAAGVISITLFNDKNGFTAFVNAGNEGFYLQNAEGKIVFEHNFDRLNKLLPPFSVAVFKKS